MATPARYDLTGERSLYRGDTEVLRVTVKEPLAATTEDPWASATVYALGAQVQAGGWVYEATAAHTSAAATEPGEGDSWATVWEQVTVAVDVTGRTYTAQVRRDTNTASPVLGAFTCVVTDGPAGEVTCTMSATVSAALPATPEGQPASARWDLQEDNGGVVTTLLAGKVRIGGDVTRAA